MTRKLLFAVLAVLISSPALAQNNGDPNTERLEVSFGSALKSGRSKIDQQSGIFREPALRADISYRTGLSFARLTSEWSNKSFGGKSFDFETRFDTISVKKINIGGNIRYFYSEDRDIFWNDGSLVVEGQMVKQYLFLGISTGIATDNGFLADLSVLLGTTWTTKHVNLYGHGDLFDGNPTLVDRDILPLASVVLRADAPEIKGFRTGFSLQQIKSLNFMNRENIKLIVPRNQTILSIEISRNLIGKLALTANAKISSSDLGMVMLGNSYGAGIKFRF